MCLEQDMNMVFIMVPFLQANLIIRSNVFKYTLSPVGNGFIKHLPAIFDNHDEMIIQQEY